MSDYFVEASVIVGGAVDTYETFDSWQAFTDWFDVERHALYPLTESVEVYVLEHEHEVELDCECVQFVTDHRPHWSNRIED